ncbi:MAG: PilZ domain-containing protein [Vulcanimicrobiaceae bacterium]
MPFFGSDRNKKRGHVERAHPRVKKPFKVQYSLDRGTTLLPALAVGISVGGLGILTNDEVTHDEFMVLLTLDEQTVTAVVQKAGDSVPGKLRGGNAWRVGGKFVGITSDHWDALARFVQNQPVKANDRLTLDLTQLQARPDDAARLLPKAALERLLGELVKMKRLAPMNSGTEPLVKLRYLGKTQRQGLEMHALRVESRVVHPHSVNNYVTQLYFDDKLARIVTIPMEQQIPEKT